MNFNLNVKLDWLMLFFLIVPLYYVAGDPTRLSQLQAFQWFTLVLVGLLHVNRYIGLFLLWTAFQCFLKVKPDPGYIHMLLYGALLIHFIAKVGEPLSYKRYYKTALAVLTITLLWSLGQYFNFDPVFKFGGFGSTGKFLQYPGLFGIPSHLGNFVAIITPMLLALSLWTLPLILISLYIAKSTFSIAAFFTALLAYTYAKSRKLALGLLILALAGGGLYAVDDFQTGQFFRRAHAWKVALRVAFKSYSTGMGPGSYGKHYVVYESTPAMNYAFGARSKVIFEKFAELEARKADKPGLARIAAKGDRSLTELRRIFQGNSIDVRAWNEIHNEYLQVFFDSGLPGLILVLLYISDTLKRYIRVRSPSTDLSILLASYLALLIVAFGHFPFQVARLAVPSLAVMGMLEGALRRECL